MISQLSSRHFYLLVIYALLFVTFLRHAMHNTAVLSHDFSQVSFPPKGSNNTPLEVPLDEANGVLSELFECNSVNSLILTENPKDILSNKFFEDDNRPLYLIALEISFDT